MVFRILTAGAFLVGAPPGATAEPDEEEPHEEPQLTPSSPREIGS